MAKVIRDHPIEVWVLRRDMLRSCRFKNGERRTTHVLENEGSDDTYREMSIARKEARHARVWVDAENPNERMELERRRQIDGEDVEYVERPRQATK